METTNNRLYIPETCKKAPSGSNSFSGVNNLADFSNSVRKILPFISKNSTEFSNGSICKRSALVILPDMPSARIAPELIMAIAEVFLLLAC
jgi:hypothetical protein